jgi:arabinofuranan 3-O-arabinosyltransferase
MPALRQGWPREPPLFFDSRAVRLASSILAASYALIFAALWFRGSTVFGHLDLSKYDFSFFWAAGRLALEGKAAAAYDSQTLENAMSGALGHSQWFAGPFFYPPVALLLLAPFAVFPYAVAAALWLVFTLAAYLAAIGRILRGGTAILAALAAPTLLFDFLIGQNGLLTAGLIGGALAVLDEHPVGAGLLIGCLAYKPQFGLVFPLLLAVAGRWRAFAAAAATVSALAALALAAFGPDAFLAFARNLPIASDAFFRHGERAVAWDHLESVYGTMRALGAGGAAAWSAHITASAVAIAAVCWSASRCTAGALAGAVAATAAVVVTPYSGLNDLAILTVAIAFLIADGLRLSFRRWEIAALGLAYMTPLLVFVVFHSPGGIGPIMYGLLAAVIGARLLAPPIAGAR